MGKVMDTTPYSRPLFVSYMLFVARNLRLTTTYIGRWRGSNGIWVCVPFTYSLACS